MFFNLNLPLRCLKTTKIMLNVFLLFFLNPNYKYIQIEKKSFDKFKEKELFFIPHLFGSPLSKIVVEISFEVLKMKFSA